MESHADPPPRPHLVVPATQSTTTAAMADGPLPMRRIDAEQTISSLIGGDFLVCRQEVFWRSKLTPEDREAIIASRNTDMGPLKAPVRIQPLRLLVFEISCYVLIADIVSGVIKSNAAACQSGLGLWIRALSLACWWLLQWAGSEDSRRKVWRWRLGRGWDRLGW